MKTLIKLLLVVLLSAITFSVTAQQYAQNTSFSGKKQYRYSDSFTDYEVQVKGDIKVNDDDTKIVSITPGGYLKISKNQIRRMRILFYIFRDKGIKSINTTKKEFTRFTF